MAVALARVTGADTTFGNKRIKVRDLTFSGTYPVGGESVTAADVGLRKIERVEGLNGIAAGSTPATAVVLGNVIASTGASVAIRSYEVGGTGAAGDPLQEKTAEAYIAGTNVRATFIGH